MAEVQRIVAVSDDANDAGGLASVTVLASDGRPLGGARLMPPCVDPILQEGQAALAVADRTGNATLNLRAPRSSIIVAPGYQSLLVELQPGHHRTVRLAPSLVQNVFCVTQDGTPLPAVRIMLSRGGVCESFEWGSAGLDTETAVHCAISNSAGLAELSGLSIGDHRVVLDPPAHHAVMRSSIQGMTAHVPGMPITFVFAEFVGCIVEFMDDEVVTFEVDETKGVAGLGSHAAESWRSSLAALRQQNPGRLVCLARPSAHADRVPSAKLRVFLRKRGWTDAREFEFAPISRLTVQRVSLPPATSSTDVAPQLSIDVVLPDGRPAPFRGQELVFDVHQSEDIRASEVARVPADGTPTLVPPGTLHLRPVSSSLGWAFGAEHVQVSPGEKRALTIAAKHSLFRVVFRPTSVAEDGTVVEDRLPFLLLNTRKAGDVIDALSFPRRSPRTAYLSCGQWSTTFFRDGCKEVSAMFEVLPCDDQIVPAQFEVRSPK